MAIFKNIGYTKASSCQVHGDFQLHNGHAAAKSPLFRKRLMYFNVYVTGYYFYICFILKTALNGTICTIRFL